MRLQDRVRRSHLVDNVELIAQVELHEVNERELWQRSLVQVLPRLVSERLPVPGTHTRVT
eukprot:3142781-Pleurochrysis_carterae.AAC.3